MKLGPVLVSTSLALFALACGATRRSGLPLEESGFLADYSILEHTNDAIPGDVEPVPRRRYINYEANWASYDKILLDPVILFRSEDIERPEAVQVLLNYCCAELRRELSRDYEIVETVQPNTMRMTVAFTRFGDRNVTMDTFSTYIPFGRAFSEIQALTSGKPSFVGYAKVEYKLVDAETGELLNAAMDKRVGGKTVKNFDSWADVRAAMDFWAKLLVFRLCLLRGESGCTPP